MLHTLLAHKPALLPSIRTVPSWIVATIVTGFVMSGSLAGQASETSGVLDLTSDVPRNEQGYPGIPGMSGGGATGGWQPGPTDTQRYPLPLGVEILHASPNNDGNFVVEVLFRNTGKSPFYLPSSRNITAVEKPGNKSRRILFLTLRAAAGGAHKGEALGFAATGGSTSIHGSFIPLDPGRSLRVLLLASSESIRRSLTKESERLGIKLSCQEWKLDDNRFFLSGISAELTSVNTIQFALRAEQIAPVQP